MRNLFAVSCTLVFCAVTASAHDFWLGAADWQPSTGSTTITAGIGEHFPTRTPTRMQADAFEAWRLLGTAGHIPVANDFVKAGLELTTTVTLPAPGAYLGVAVIKAQTIEMKGEEFTDYLEEEGLDATIAARQAAGEAGKTTTERYARYAKIALRMGAGSGSHLTRPAGLKAEFVPAVDPTLLRAGQPLALQFLVDGTPAAGATIMAVSDGKVAKAQSDREGRVTFAIDRSGPWLIKAIHMVRLPPGAPTEWESFWATLTFHAGA